MKKQRVDPMLKAMLIQAKRNACKEADVSIMNVYLALPLFVLHNNFGWGKTRCERFAEAALEILDSYDKGLISIDDVVQTLKEETGFDVIEAQLSRKQTAAKSEEALAMYNEYQEERAKRQRNHK